MSDILVTDALGTPKEEYVAPERDNSPFTFDDPRVEAAIPTPTGYQILIVLPEPEETSEGGIIKPEQVRRDEQVSAIVGQVIRMGPDCYKDANRFPNGAYCEVGDWVVFHAYSGTRLKTFGVEMRLINDDTVKAVVTDPRGIVRA